MLEQSREAVINGVLFFLFPKFVFVSLSNSALKYPLILGDFVIRNGFLVNAICTTALGCDVGILQ